jgi:prephenate dehydrogenase
VSDPDFRLGDLMNRRVAIIGVGLIGGSLAYSLQGKCMQLFGVDSNLDVVATARSAGIFDEVSTDLASIASRADLLILCVPVRQSLKILPALPQAHPGEAVVLDTGSTKAEIVQAMRGLPERLQPVGGHPMCGKEFGGFRNAENDLFRGATFALVEARPNPEAVGSLVENLVRAIGGVPIWLDAETHDRWAASISHLPYLVALSLARAAPFDSGRLAGPGFRSATRLAATPPRMMLDVLSSNRSHLLESLANFKREVFIVESLLAANDDDALSGWLEEGKHRHAEMVKRQGQSLSGED